jgi:hypothetical protein
MRTVTAEIILQEISELEETRARHVDVLEDYRTGRMTSGRGVPGGSIIDVTPESIAMHENVIAQIDRVIGNYRADLAVAER